MGKSSGSSRGGRPVLWRPMVRLAVPTILENLLQSAVFLIDAIMLAQVGELELAAVSLTGIFLWRTTEIVACVQRGTAAFVARRWGEHGYERACAAATHGFVLAGVLGLAAAAAVFPFLGWIFARLGGEADLVPVAVHYAGMVLLAFPFTQMFINLSASVRAAGDTRTPAMATVLVNLCNVFLNYALIFGHFGMPRLGMLGAGIATGLSFVVGWVFLTAMTARGLHPKSLFNYPVYAETDGTEKAIEAGGVAAVGHATPAGREQAHAAIREAARPAVASMAAPEAPAESVPGGGSSETPSVPLASVARPPSPVRALPTGRFGFRRAGARLWLSDVTPTVLRIARPTLVEEIFISIGFLAFIRMIAASGTTAMAAHSAVVRIESLSFMLGMGFTVSASTMVGQALGRGDTALARRVFWLCTMFAMVFMGLLGIVFCLFPAWLLAPFDVGGEFMAIAIPLLIIAALEQPLLGSAAVLAGGLRGAGDTLSPMISQFFGTIGVRVGIGYVLAFPMGFGIQGVYFATVLDWAVRTLILAVLVMRGRWRRIQL